QPIGNGSNYSGLIDELTLYTRALSSNEIAAIYQAGVSGKCPLPPTFIPPPTGQTVLTGSKEKFRALASGTPSLSYQWTFNGTNILSATNSTLTITNVQWDQAGIYAVQVVNGVGIISSNATLIVLSPPIITSQPVTVTIFLGSNATFNVVAIGTTPLSYQWKRNGSSIVGATNNALNLTNVQFNQAGNYSVQITNGLGSLASSNALLTVNALYHFTWTPISATRFVNTPFAVTVTALNGTNGVAGDFSGNVSLSLTNGVLMSPNVSGAFVQGVWTGLIAISQTGTNLVLQAVDSFGENGFANAIR